MRCDVCRGTGKLATFECGRCAGKGRRLNFALLDLLTLSLLVAGVAGVIGYLAITHVPEVPEDEAPPQWHSSSASAEVSP